jgi:hypothetical protein
MMKQIALTMLLTLPVLAADPWTGTQLALEGTYQSALLCDWRQTSNFHKTWGHTCETYEANPLLGRHPSQATINQMCLLSSLGHLAISAALPHRWRTTWQGVTLAGEVYVAFVNNRPTAGVHVRF